MEYELPSNHGVWGAQKKPEDVYDRKKKSIFIHDSPPRSASASLFVTKTCAQVLAQPVEPPQDDSQCFVMDFGDLFLMLCCVVLCFSSSFLCISSLHPSVFYAQVLRCGDRLG